MNLNFYSNLKYFPCFIFKYLGLNFIINYFIEFKVFIINFVNRQFSNLYFMSVGLKINFNQKLTFKSQNNQLNLTFNYSALHELTFFFDFVN